LAPVRPRLGENEVHVWRADLDQPPATLQALFAILTEDERSRSARFCFARDAERFVVARGLLRTILGLYLQEQPARLRFRYNAFGKPELSTPADRQSLRFNISHSQNQALFALSSEWEIGVDIEYVREVFDMRELADCVFSPYEVSALRVLPAYEQTQAFFNCWTRKEAYVKARGEGFSFPLDCFDVSLAPGEPAVLLSHRQDPREMQRWSLCDLSSDSSYASALVVESQYWRIQCWDWNNRLA
jgi:4'-phosphopantetheinyl transferase